MTFEGKVTHQLKIICWRSIIRYSNNNIVTYSLRLVEVVAIKESQFIASTFPYHLQKVWTEREKDYLQTFSKDGPLQLYKKITCKSIWRDSHTFCSEAWSNQNLPIQNYKTPGIKFLRINLEKLQNWVSLPIYHIIKTWIYLFYCLYIEDYAIHIKDRGQ